MRIKKPQRGKVVAQQKPGLKKPDSKKQNSKNQDRRKHTAKEKALKKWHPKYLSSSF